MNPMSDANGRTLVLVADDLDDIRLLASTTLSDAGYDVIEARDGNEAVELILEHRPALAVLDVMMPNCDGFEALERVRATKPVVRTRVLIMTAFAAHADFGPDGPGAAADEYLLKPFSPDELVTRARRLFGR